MSNSFSREEFENRTSGDPEDIKKQLDRFTSMMAANDPLKCQYQILTAGHMIGEDSTKCESIVSIGGNIFGIAVGISTLFAEAISKDKNLFPIIMKMLVIHLKNTAEFEELKKYDETGGDNTAAQIKSLLEKYSGKQT